MTKKIVFYLLIIPFFIGCTNQLKVTNHEFREKNQGPVKGEINVEGNDLLTEKVTFIIINESEDAIHLGIDLSYGTDNKVSFTFPDGQQFYYSSGGFGYNKKILPGENWEYVWDRVYDQILSYTKRDPPDGIYKVRWINAKYNIDLEEEFYYTMAEYARKF